MFIEKYMYVSGLVQFEPMLFKGELYSMLKTSLWSL